MRTEDEIRKRLTFYQGVLTSCEAMKAVDSPNIWLNLTNIIGVSDAIQALNLDPELRREHATAMEHAISLKVETLQWVLDSKPDEKES